MAVNELLDFDWEGNENENFFGIEPEITEEQKEIEEAKKIAKKETEEPIDSKPEKIEEEPEEFFEETKEDKKSKTSKEVSSENTYVNVFKDLKENGIFKHIELEEEEDIDADRFLELQEEEYETEVTERIKNWADQLDEDARAFIKFKKEGGNTEDFFEIYKESSELPKGDVEDEDYQDQIIRYQLREEGWDSDEIEDRLQYLTESGKKQKVAERYNVKLKQEIEERKIQAEEQAKQQRLAAQQQKESYKKNIKESLEQTSEIKGFKITPKEKNKIFNFLTKEEYKVSDSRAITGFQKKLAEVFQDTEKTILLAKIIENDFDFKDLEKQISTSKTKEIKKDLEQRKGMRPSNSGSSLVGSSLADLF